MWVNSKAAKSRDGAAYELLTRPRLEPPHDRSSTLSNSLDGRKEGSSPSVALVRLVVDLQAAASPEGPDKQHGGQDSREYGHHDCHSENVFADHA